MKEISTESQKQAILDWLSEGNTITALQALNSLVVCVWQVELATLSPRVFLSQKK